MQNLDAPCLHVKKLVSFGETFMEKVFLYFQLYNFPELVRKQRCLETFFFFKS